MVKQRTVVELNQAKQGMMQSVWVQLEEGAEIRSDSTMADKFLSVSSPGKVAAIFRDFDDQKKNLVRSIGFGGMLQLPFHDKIDDKLTYWLLKNLDIETMTIRTQNGDALPVRDGYVHIVLGIPFTGNLVYHENQYSRKVVSAVSKALLIDNQGMGLTLDYLEVVLTKDYSGGMSKEEKNAFRIAIVLYSMVHFLGVFQPRPCFPLWLLRNFLDVDKISQINWSGYMLLVIAHGAQLVQKQKTSRDIVFLLDAHFSYRYSTLTI